MTTARQTYAATIASAAITRAAANLQAEMQKQVAIDAQRSVVGLKLQNGNASLVTAIATANAAKVATDIANEQSQQATVEVARDTLRNAGGDSGAF
jgi:hypothetical protein